MVDFGIGHNQPPEPIELGAEEMRLALQEFDQRRANLIGAVERVKVNDEESAGAAADLARMMRALVDRADSIFDTKAAPYREQLNGMRSATDKFTSPIKQAREKVVEIIDTFRDKQRERAERLRQEQYDAEQARRAELAGAAPPDPVEPPVEQPRTITPVALPLAAPVTRGDLGGTARDRKIITVEIENIALIEADILNSDKVRAAICAVAKDMAKHRRTIPGIRITRGHKTQVI